MKTFKPKLVRLKVISSNEEITCVLCRKNKYYYTFYNESGGFNISIDDIEYIDTIGDVIDEE